MTNNSILILVGGASTRMKKSLASSGLSAEIKEQAGRNHKSLIPVDSQGRPLLYYLLKNAKAAGIQDVFLITSENNQAFHEFIRQYEKEFPSLRIHIAIQYVPADRSKPLGTADAVLQCLKQYPHLQKERFTVCNGDNLYSSKAMELLREHRTAPNALIAYQGSALGHPLEKIMRFALLDFDEEGVLLEILEKPTEVQLDAYRLRHHKYWVSMNLFNFSGPHMFNALQNCPFNKDRGEKELPTAVKMMLSQFPKGMICYKRAEKVPDLTSASDLEAIQGQLD